MFDPKKEGVAMNNLRGSNSVVRAGMLALVMVGLMGVGGVSQEDSLWEAFEKAVPLVEAPGSPIIAPNQITAIVIGDFNNDGHLDIVGAGHELLVWLGNGNGTFQLVEYSCRITDSLIAGTFQMLAADLNSDGNLDIVIADASKNCLYILVGDGVGGFSPAASSPIEVGEEPIAVGTGDFNQDGHVDLVVANYRSSDVHVLLGDGTGRFASAPGAPIPVASPTSLTVGDLDEDGHLDIVCTELDGTLVLLRGQGTGWFNFLTVCETGKALTKIIKGDFDGDGHLDLLVAAEKDGGWLAPGKGDGSFGNLVSIEIDGHGELTVNDFNNDGYLDLAIVNFSDSVSLQFGDGRGNFSKPVRYAASVKGSNAAVALGDINEDGFTDVILCDRFDSSIMILMSAKSEGFVGPIKFKAELPYGVALGDFNGDGRADLAAGTAEGVLVLLGNGKGVFRIEHILATFSWRAIPAVIVGDYNGDGHLDIVAVNHGGDNVLLFLSNGDGGFYGPFAFETGKAPISAVSADFNVDGHLDLVVANSKSADLSVLLGNGEGGFNRISRVSVGEEPWSVVTGDFDADNYPDIAVVNSAGNNLSILLNDGRGNFRVRRDFRVGMLPTYVITGDFNNDGCIDLAVANADSNSVTILINDGRGSFLNLGEHCLPGTGNKPIALANLDFNNDQLLDLVVVTAVVEGPVAKSILILQGDGKGNFEFAYSYEVGFGPFDAVAGHLDEHPGWDLVVTYPYALDRAIVVLLNLGEVR